MRLRRDKGHLAGRPSDRNRPCGAKSLRTKSVVGPLARYQLTRHNIGLCDDDVTVSISFSEGEKRWWSDLEYALCHLDEFDEPSRHNILASAAAHYGIPFAEMMGGVL